MNEQRDLRLEDLCSLTIPSDPQLAPDGRTVAFVVTRPLGDSDDYESSIWLRGVDGGAAVRLTPGPSDRAPRWSPRGDSIAFVSSRRAERGTTWLRTIAIGSGADQALCEQHGASEPVWSPDGDRIAFTAIVDPRRDTTPAPHRPVVIDRLGYKTDGQGLIGYRRRQLFVVPVAGGHAKQLTFDDCNAGSPTWSPDGSQIAFAGSSPSDADLTGARQVFVVRATGGMPEALTPADAQFIPADWSADGRALLIAGMAGLEVAHTRLYTVSLAGGRLTQVAPGLDRNVLLGEPGYPGGQPCFAGHGSTVVFCASDRGCAHIFAASSGSARKVIGGGDQVVSGMSVAGERMAFVAATADSPGEVYVANLDGSDQRQLTRLFVSQLPGVRLHRFEARTFRSSDGALVQAWLLRRNDVKGATPLLLDIHSGPHNAWGPAFNGCHLYHQTMATAGWTILCVNPRGSDGYGASFYRAAVGQWGIADEHDLLCAVDQLVEEGCADPARLAVTGYSYGGYMSAWLTTRTDRFAAAVVGGGTVNLASAARTSDASILLGRRELDGWPHEVPDQYTALSPITHVANVAAATLILHGECDHRVPVGQGEEWFAALRSLQRIVELVCYPGAGHLFILTGPPSQRVDYCRRVADWADRHAGPGALAG